MSFNPLSDVIKAPDGSDFKLEPPKQAPEVPENGFVQDTMSYIAPPDDGSDVEVVVDPGSDRLQLLDPFPAWSGEDFNELPLLVDGKSQFSTMYLFGPSAVGKSHLLHASCAYADAQGKTSICMSFKEFM